MMVPMENIITNTMDQINKLPVLLSTTLYEHGIFFHSTVLRSGNTSYILILKVRLQYQLKCKTQIS